MSLGVGVGVGLGMAFGVGRNRARGRGRDLGHRLRSMVMYTAAHGPLPREVHPPNSREAAVLAFVTAASSFPSTISVTKRRALEVSLTSHQIYQVAMAASFAAFYSTIVSLLGLDDTSLTSPALDRVRASLNFEALAMDLNSSDRDSNSPDRRCNDMNNDHFDGFRLRAGPSSLASSSTRTVADESELLSSKDSSASHHVASSLFSRLRISSGNSTNYGRGRGSAPPAPGGRFHDTSEQQSGRKTKSRFSYKRRFFERSGQAQSTPTSPMVTSISKPSRMTQTFKQAAAVRALHSTEEFWLSSIPSDEEHQDRYLNGLCGFVPEYVRQVSSLEDRRALILALSFLCNADGEGQIPAATRLVMSYVLSKAAENPVLSAHAGFLAVRFGTTLGHLQIACDYPLLLDMRDEYDRLRKRSSRAHRDPAGSTITSSSSGGNLGGGSFGDAYDDDLLDSLDSEPFPYVDDDSSDEGDEPIHIVDTSIGGGQFFGDADRQAAIPVQKHATDAELEHDISTDCDRDVDEKRIQMVCSASSLAADDLDGADSSDEEADGSYSSNDSQASAETESVEFTDPVEQSRSRGTCDDQDYDDEPQVPCIDPDPRASKNCAYNEPAASVDTDGGHIPFPQPDESLLKKAMWMFTECDVALLILTHQSARSARRSSSVGISDVGRMQLGPKDVETLSDTLSPPAIVEGVTVIAVQTLLQRWTSVYPYRAGALENAVRRFVQGPVGHELDVRSVGQRCASRMDSDFSATSLSQQSRRRPSLHLPRRMMSSL